MIKTLRRSLPSKCSEKTTKKAHQQVGGGDRVTQGVDLPSYIVSVPVDYVGANRCHWWAAPLAAGRCCRVDRARTHPPQCQPFARRKSHSSAECTAARRRRSHAWSTRVGAHAGSPSTHDWYLRILSKKKMIQKKEGKARTRIVIKDRERKKHIQHNDSESAADRAEVSNVEWSCCCAVRPARRSSALCSSRFSSPKSREDAATGA